MNVNLEYYEVFYHVYTHGNLAAAAQELYISQPTVSQAVWQLEKEAGTKLFFRTSKGMQLTREGELLYHYVKPGVGELLEGGKMLEWMLNMDMGEARIGASDMTLQFYLLPCLEQFHREYPKVKMNITNTPTPETIKSLEEGRTDFGVMTSPSTSGGTVRQFQVKTIRNVFITGSNFRESGERKPEYKELEAFPYIALERNTSTKTFMDTFLAQQGTLLRPKSELAINDMIVQFARRNMGTGCVMEGFAEGAIMRGEVFRLKFKQETPLRHVCMVTGESSLISVPGRELLDMTACGQAAAEQPAGDRQQKVSLLQKKDISNTYGKHNK